MKKIYYLLSTMTAFLCLNAVYLSDDSHEINPVKIQHIDMSDYPIFINGKKGK